MAAGCAGSDSGSGPAGAEPTPGAVGSAPPANGGSESGGGRTGAPAGNGGGAPTCTSKQLALQIGGSSPAAGTTITHLFLRNAGSEACRLKGSPTVTFLDGQSQPTGQAVTSTGPAGSAVTLAPTEVASSVLRTPSSTCTKTSGASQAVRVVAPGDDGTLQTSLDVDLCGPSTVTSLVAGTGDAPSGPAVPAPDPVSAETCSSAHLALTVGTNQYAAGTQINDLVLRNAGTVPCRIEGFPGVSLLDRQYRQAGQPAQQTGNTPPGGPIVLAPGDVAHARLFTGRAGCNGNPVEAVRVQVYPPGERGPLQNAILAYACGTPRIEPLSPGTAGA